MRPAVKFCFVLILFLLMLCIPEVSNAQYPTDPGDDPDGVPISGVEILLGVGGALGIKKFLSLRKNKT